MVKSIVINGGGNCSSSSCKKSNIASGESFEAYNSLRTAIRDKDETIDFKRLITEYKDKLNLQDHDGKTVLMHAIEYMPSIAEELIKKGVDLNIQDKRGRTALMHAIEFGNKEVAEKLIEKGANLDIQDEHKNTALMYAIKYMPEVAKELIEKGANLDIQDEHKNTALMYAIFIGNKEVAKKLIEAEANLNIQDTSGRTALMDAIVIRDIEVAKKLIEAEADLNIQDTSGRTALMHAIINGEIEVAEKLIEAEADLNIQDTSGRTALMHAINKPDIIKFIIDTVINHVNDVEYLHSDTYVNDFIVSNNLVNEMRKETLDMDIKRQFARPILAYTYSFHKFGQVMLDRINLDRSENKKSNYSYALGDPLSIVHSFISPEIYMYLKPDEIEQVKNAYNYSNQNSSVTKYEMDDYIQRIIAHDNSKKSGGKKRKTKKEKRGNKSKESRKGKKSRKERKSRKGKKNKR